MERPNLGEHTTFEGDSGHRGAIPDLHRLSAPLPPILLSATANNIPGGNSDTPPGRAVSIAGVGADLYGFDLDDLRRFGARRPVFNGVAGLC